MPSESASAQYDGAGRRLRVDLPALQCDPGGRTPREWRNMQAGSLPGRAIGELRADYSIAAPVGRRDFHMPVNIPGVRAVLLTVKVRSHVSREQLSSPEQSARVAWRIAKDWLEAQLALIQARMVTLDQVMLPYLEVGRGETLYDAFSRGTMKELEA